jgi:diguanylate cyclase (GGDEF)-like protein
MTSIARVLAAAVLLIALPLSALDASRGIGQYTVSFWQGNDGLPQESVQAITQTRDGYLWVGTLAGLARFDGVTFTVFDKRNTPALADNAIQSLVEDKDGTLWIATGGGGIVRWRNGRFDVFAEAQGATSETVWSLMLTRRGELWAGSLRHGIFIWRGSRFEPLNVPGIPRTLTALAMFEDRNGAIWIGTEHDGMYRYAAGVVEHFHPANGFAGETIRVFAEDRDGTFHAGGDNGLFRRDGERFVRITTADGLASDLVRALRLDGDGNFWVGTYGGLSRIREGVLETFPADRLPSPTIRSLFEDREHNLWLGTGGGGLVRLKDSVAVSLTSREGLPNNSVRAILQDRSGAMWLGTYGGGLSSWRDGRMVSSWTTRNGMLDDVVFALAEDHEGAIWAGTRKGVSRLEHGRVTNLTVKDGLPAEVVRALFVDRDGAVWIGTVSGGLSRYAKGRIESLTTRDGLSSDSIFWISQSRDGAIWTATYGGGLNRISGRDIRVYRKKDGLPTDRVWSIYEDRDGVMWLGTRGGGLVRFKDGRFSRIQVTDGLFDDVVYSVLEDAQNNLWMSGNRGIWRVAKSQLNGLADGGANRVTSYPLGRADGLPSSECNGGSQPSSWKAADGRLWFSTIGGAAIIDPSRLETTDAPPPVRIETILADGVALPVNQGIRVPPGSEQLEIRYSGIGLAMPERVRFRYRLEGYDSQWREAGARRVAFYTRVPPGTYRFRVLASTGGELWPADGTSVELTLLPRLWQTRTFLLCMCLLAIVAWYSVYRWRVRALRTRARELADLVSQRTSELRLANDKLLEVSRVDGLTGVSTRRRFDEVLEEEWRRGMRDRLPVSLMMIDIDCFKSYNDGHGHLEGDEALRQVASQLRSAAKRAGDLVARYGGEEFALVLHATPLEQATELAESVRSAVHAMAIPHPGSSVSTVVTISVGVATAIPSHGTEPEALLAAADAMLYEAKEAGRNQVRATQLAGSTPTRAE